MCVAHVVCLSAQVSQIKTPKTQEDEFFEIQTSTGTPLQRWAVRTLTLIKLVNSSAAFITHTDVCFTHRTSLMRFPHTGVEEHRVALSSRSETCDSAHGCYLVHDGLQVRDGLNKTLFTDYLSH